MVAPATGGWGLLGTIALARIAMGGQMQSVGALGPLLLATPLAPGWTALGALIGGYSLAGVFASLPAGWLLARLGDRRVLVAGLVLMTAGGAVLAVAPGFGVALAARLVAGTGGTLVSIACAKLVLDRFAGPRLVLAMGLMLAAWPCGIGLALVALPRFGEAWRDALLAVALVCAAALPAVLLGLRGAAVPQAPPRLRLRPGEWPKLLAIGVVWAGMNAAFAVVVGFAPAFLVARGMDPVAAGGIASVVGFAILPLLPIGGPLAQRLGRPASATALCVLGMAAALIALLAGAPPVPMLIAFGLLTAPPASLVMALLGDVLSAESRAFGVGLHYTMFYVALAAIPPLAGLARDATGAAGAPLMVAIGCLGVALAALAALAVLQALRRR